MVGASAMGPEPITVAPLDDENEEEARKRVLKRFEKIGVQIMNRTSAGGPFAQDPIAACSPTGTSAQIAAQILGQAYISAHNLVLHNKDAVEKIADELVVRSEMFGDELRRDPRRAEAEDAARSTTRARKHGRRCDPCARRSPSFRCCRRGATGRVRAPTASASASSTSSSPRSSAPASGRSSCSRPETAGRGGTAGRRGSRRAATRAERHTRPRSRSVRADDRLPSCQQPAAARRPAGRAGPPDPGSP